MKLNRRRFGITSSVGLIGIVTHAWRCLGDIRTEMAQQTAHASEEPDLIMPRFTPVQPDLFAAAGAQPNCWADFDNDGDLDLFVGFKGGLPNRLYRNNSGMFTEVGTDLGLADLPDTRAAAWGDFNADGQIDLYVGFSRKSGARNKLYRNDGNGKHFTDVARDLGVDVMGETRQISWIDFDNDGNVDLFVAFRDAPNMLFHNEGDRFVDVAKDMGVDDPRKSVGAVWFDYNQDGRLDLFVANQDGTLNGLFRNDGNRFVDVAHELGMDAAGRPSNNGSNGPSVIDFDNDGNLDLFVAGYGPNFLYRNDGQNKFINVAAEMGVLGGDKATPSNWGDYDNDGRPDLYVSSYVDRPLNEHDSLYHNGENRFSQVIPWEILRDGATHGVQWADFDGDGALDLALANNNPSGHHYLWRNLLPSDRARRSLQVLVLDERGRYTKAGSEARIYAPGTHKILGTRLVDTGSGYCSQNVMPVHFGLPTDGNVDVEVTTMSRDGRKITRVANVDANKLVRRTLVLNIKANGAAKDRRGG
jgi:hypothetical protein